MRGWGIFIIVMAVGSAILPYFGLQFVVVGWVDMWGPTIGWLIRAGLIVLGVGLVAAPRFLASKPADSSDTPRH